MDLTLVRPLLLIGQEDLALLKVNKILDYYSDVRLDTKTSTRFRAIKTFQNVTKSI